MTFSHARERAFYDDREDEGAPALDALAPYLDAILAAASGLDVRGRTVLEIGAGPAGYSALLASTHGAARVLALDLVARQIEVRPGVAGVGGDVLRLPVRDASVDVVFGSLILHRFRPLAPVAREIARVLRPGGSYVGMEPSLRNPAHLYRQVLGTHSPNEVLLTTGEIERAFAAAGLKARTRGIAPRHPRAARWGFASCVAVHATKPPAKGA